MIRPRAPVAKITSDPVAMSNTLVQKWYVIAAWDDNMSNYMNASAR